jgi:hypothetical protein
MRDLAWSSAQLHPRTVRHNRVKPRRHLRLPPELIQMPESGHERILNHVLGVGRIAHVSMSLPIKRR